MRKFSLLAKLGYLLGLLGLVKLKTLFIVVKEAMKQEGQQQVFPPPETIEQQRLERIQKFIQAEQAPRLLTWEDMEMMKRYMANRSSFQFHTPGYGLTHPSWGELTPTTEWSEYDLNELKWEQGAQVQREATAIVNELQFP